MLGGRFQMVDGDSPVPATEVFTIRVEGGKELRYLDFETWDGSTGSRTASGRSRAGLEVGPEADSVPRWAWRCFGSALRRFRDELKDLLRNQEFLAGIGKRLLRRDPVRGAAASVTPAGVPQAGG